MRHFSLHLFLIGQDLDFNNTQVNQYVLVVITILNKITHNVIIPLYYEILLSATLDSYFPKEIYHKYL